MNIKVDGVQGVWRTIGGRRVFIKAGQSLSEAMKESGKFKNLKKEDYKTKTGDPIDDLIKKEGINVGGRLREVDDETIKLFEMINEKGLDDDQAKFILHSKYYDSNEDNLLDKYKKWKKEQQV